MRITTYTPNQEGYSGSIKISLPNYPQRIRLYKELTVNYAKDENGNFSITLNDNIKDNQETIAKMVELSSPYVQSVDIKFGELEAKSYDDLNDYPEFYTIVNDVIGIVFGGTKLGGQ